MSSAGQAPIDFDDVMLERNYSGVQAYCQSKLALVMLTFDLAEELEGTGVTANCLHPGARVATVSGSLEVSPLDEQVAVPGGLPVRESRRRSHAAGGRRGR